MILRILLVLEAMTMIVVLHSISGCRMKFDIKTLIIMLVNIIFLEIINTYELNRGFTYITIVSYIIYCTWMFKASLLNSLKYTFLCMIQVTIIQFVWTIILSALGMEDYYKIGMWVNFITFLCNLLIIMWKKTRYKRSVLRTNNPMVYVAMIFAAILVMAMLYQVKLGDGLQAEMFVFAVIAVILMLIFMECYQVYQIKCIELENELETQYSYGRWYIELLKKVRIRQHNINNQIAAILGTHYVYKTYEELVKYQEEYCGKIVQSDKYNSLLWLGDDALAGFLYKKFIEMEQQGCNIVYKAKVKKLQLKVQTHYLIEILGILLDNAIEAILQEHYEKIIRVNINEDSNSYIFEILNPYCYVPFAEIGEWFTYENSSKGNERGIGLYRVREICQEQMYEIECNNVEMENTNWIRFCLYVKKQGD